MREDYVKQFSLAKTTRQSLISLFFNLGAILAGFIIVGSLEVFLKKLWIIALFPGILSMRGVVGGLFSGRLSTSLHLGTIEAKFLGRNTKNLGILQNSIILLTFESSILLAIAAIPFGVVFWESQIFDILAIFVVLLATMGLSLLAISPITTAVAFSSFKKGLDPDIVVYPIIATVADIMVTLCYIFVLNLFFLAGSIGQYIVLLLCCGFIYVAMRILHGNRRETEFLKIIKESTYSLIIVSIIVNITGSLLSQISGIVKNKPEIYIVYPALIDTMGSVGAIIGSTATTKLALGTIDSSFRSIKKHRNQIIGAWVASTIMFAIYASFSFAFQVSAGFNAILRFLTILLATNIFAAVFMISISFAVAILTFKRGLDPDNFVIPIESSLADTITTISLLVMLGLIGGI